MALSACVGDKDSDIQTVYKFTNSLNKPDLDLLRIVNYELGEKNITRENSMEVYQDLELRRYSNVTEFRSVSQYIYQYYGNVLWITKFGTSFTNLMNMYELNENKTLVQTILKENGFDKLKVQQPEKRELRDKFREILKWCLVGNHAITKNMNISLNLLNSTLDNLWSNLREEIIDEITYDPSK